MELKYAARADTLGLVFDSDPRHDKGPAPHSAVAEPSECSISA